MRNSGSDSERWTALLRGLTHDAVLWLLFVMSATCYRALLCGSFVRDARAIDVVHALLVGVRFDAVLATALVTPSLALGVIAYVSGRRLPTDHIRTMIAFAACVAGPLLYAIDYAFFREFSDHLNVRVMIALEGATESLPETIWKAHQPLRLLFLAALTSAAALAVVRRVLATSLPHSLRTPPKRSVRLALAVVGLGVYIVLLRGISIGDSPIRVRNAFVTPNAVLNRTIPSPIATLLHAMEDRRQERDAPSAGMIAAAARTISSVRGERIPDDFVAHARGAGRRPRHVFVILMEGQHGFPVLPWYRSAGLAPELSKLAERGAFFPSFLSAGPSTDTSLAAIVSGLLLPDSVLSHDERALAPFPTSLAAHFKALGYRTRFFYGGYLGWARLDLFLAGQGFDEVLGAPDTGGAAGNAWGVWDGGLYDAVLRRVDDGVPSLNVILTTTNHSPYDLPAQLRPQLGPSARDLAGGDAQTLAVFEHEAYADRELGRFVTVAEERLRGALFVVTGDHTAHAAHPRLGEDRLGATTVPMIIAGEALPPRLRGSWMRAGSHLDIAPTLYELCAPQGYAYRSFGVDLFAPRRRNIGVGSPWVLGEHVLAAEDSTVYALDAAAGSGDEARDLLAYQKAVRTLSLAVLHARPASETMLRMTRP
jgi:phosphoglycerol transferase MdoB-like AlkP superfamily enzyme